jgi:hypothetical protein
LKSWVRIEAYAFLFAIISEGKCGTESLALRWLWPPVPMTAPTRLGLEI